jgi:hypothetical protein
MKTNIMAPLVRNASRFLFPCTVEYSLLCTVILGVMWLNACSEDKNNHNSPQTPDNLAGRISGVNVIYSRSVSQFSVDCTSAHKGLFAGILMLVLSIVSLIMFYELVKRPELVEVAVLQVSIPHCTGKCSLLQNIQPKFYVSIPLLPHACYTSCPFHHVNIWQTVSNTKPLNMRFCAVVTFFLPLRT